MREMGRLIVSSETGYGKFTNKNGDEFVVLRTDGYYSLGVYRKGGFLSWVKEDVKRISTIQKLVDEREYGFTIEII